MKRIIVLCAALSACAEMPAPPVSAGADRAAAAGADLFIRPAINSGNFHLPDFQKIVLANGAVVLLHEKKDLPFIDATAVIAGGAVADATGKSGTASLTAALLEKGAGARDAVSFAQDVAFAGGQIRASASLESISVAARFLHRDEELLLELLGDMLMQPHFDQQQFTKVRARRSEFLKAARESDPRGLMAAYGSAWLFADHPYGRPVSGDETSLSGLTRSDIRDFYRDQFGGDRLILALVGNFDADSMAQKVRAKFGRWRAAAQTVPPIAPPSPAAGGQVLLVDKPGATQAYFWLGAIGVNRAYPQRAALNIVNTIFGGRFTSMLNTELRVKSGLTYGAASRLSRPTQAGSLSISSYTQTDKIVAAIDLALATLQRLHVEGIDAEAADSARNYILGQFPTGLETGGQLAANIATLEFYGLGRTWIDDYASAIRAVDAHDIERVIATVYPATDAVTMVVLGDAERIRAGLQKYGRITRIALSAPGFPAPLMDQESSSSL